MVHQFVSTNMPICSMHYKGLLEMEESEPSPRDLRRSTAQTLALELLSISLQCPDPRWEAILPSDSTFAYVFTENKHKLAICIERLICDIWILFDILVKLVLDP